MRRCAAGGGGRSPRFVRHMPELELFGALGAGGALGFAAGWVCAHTPAASSAVSAASGRPCSAGRASNKQQPACQARPDEHGGLKTKGWWKGCGRELRYLRETPEIDEFRSMRVRAGLSAKSHAAAARGLPSTLFAVCVRDGEQLVGMGRVVGDGGLNFEVVDVAVHPDYQRQGIGYRMMEMLMTAVNEAAPPTALVSLLADQGAPALYRKFGFKPSAPASIGMALRIS